MSPAQSDAQAPIRYRASFSEEEFDVIRRGLEPRQMEDKWNIRLEGDWLHFRRSWTGCWVYRLRFERRGDRHAVVEALVTADHSVYRRNIDAYETALVDFLIRGLMLGRDVKFPLPPDLDAHEGVFQHHIAGSAYPTRRVVEPLWSKLRQRIMTLASKAPAGDEPHPIPEASAPVAGRQRTDDFGLVLARPTTADLVNDTCFVCGESRERPGGLPRLACGRCRSRARLMNTGASIHDLIRPLKEGDFPLESSTLAFLLSPVQIDDKRGWTEFVAGGWGVHEELIPSDDAFTYRLRHYEPFASGLRQIRAREMLEALRSRSTIAVYIELSAEAQRVFDKLCSWYHQARLGASIRRERPIHTNHDAWAAARLAVADDSGMDATEMLERLIALQGEAPVGSTGDGSSK